MSRGCFRMKYPKAGGLEKQKCIVAQFWGQKSEIKVLAESCSLRRARGGSAPGLSGLLVSWLLHASLRPSNSLSYMVSPCLFTSSSLCVSLVLCPHLPF